MFNVEQLPFLYTLGYAIGHSLWQMSLIWLAYTGISSIQKWNSPQRYNLAVGAVIAGVVSFVITLVYFSLRISSGEISMPSALQYTPVYIAPENGIFYYYHTCMATLRSLAPYFSCAYILVMLLMVARLVNGFRQVETLKTQGLQKAPVDWRIFVNDHAGLLGIGKKVILYVSNVATSPVTIGYIKPIILLPVASINNLSAQQMEAILLHELAHIKRNDYLVNIFLQLAEVILFFNPFMRLVLKQARIERENCCDDYVLQFRYNAADYAQALLSIEKQSSINMLALGSNNKNEFQLLNRVKRMLSPERRSFNYKQQLGLLFLFTVIALAFTVIIPAKSLEKTETVTDVKVAKENIASAGFETFLPQAIQFVKNLEKLNIDNSANKPVAQNNKQTVSITPHKKLQVLQEMKAEKQAAEQAALANAKTEMEIASKDLQELTVSLHESLPPFVMHELSSKVVPAITAVPAEIIKAIPPALFAKAKQKAELDALQKQIELQARKLEQASRIKMALNDSLYYNNREIALLEREEAKRSKKQMAIAPFRVWSRSEINNRNISANDLWQNINDDDADEALEVAATSDEKRTTIRLSKNNKCNCPQSITQQQPIIVFNGKILAGKMKKVLEDVQRNVKNSWNEDVQQKINAEIQHELESLQNFQIKTQVSNTTNGRTRSFVIEVETDKKP